MTTTRIIVIITMLMFSLFNNKTRSVQANDSSTKSSHESFDFYVHPDSSSHLYDCEIKGVPCKYNEAVPLNKKPLHHKAIYIGTGKINIEQIISDEYALTQTKITIFRIINIELDRGLSQGVDAIWKLLDPQEDMCAENIYYRNSYFNEMIANLTRKIEMEIKTNNTNKSIQKGQYLSRKLQCSN